MICVCGHTNGAHDGLDGACTWCSCPSYTERHPLPVRKPHDHPPQDYREDAQ